MDVPTPVPDTPNTWHTELDGDAYFISPIDQRRAKWRITRQVDMSSVYRSHTVTIQRNAKIYCDCEGHRRNGKCRHVDMIKILIKA